MNTQQFLQEARQQRQEALIMIEQSRQQRWQAIRMTQQAREDQQKTLIMLKQARLAFEQLQLLPRIDPAIWIMGQHL